MALASLELNWLSRRDKQLILPDIVFHDFSECQGCYCQPHWYGKAVDGIEVKSRNGTIIVNPRTSSSIAATMAHEWRHHWQYHRGVLGASRWIPTAAGYWADIVQYFQIPHERDALEFECRVAPEDLNLEFLSILR
jgi:hypothetical protein